MVSAHDPENGPGTSGPGNSRPSLTHPQKPAGTAADQQVSRLVTPDTTEIPGRSEYRENQPGISDKSYRAKRRTRRGRALVEEVGAAAAEREFAAPAF